MKNLLTNFGETATLQTYTHVPEIDQHAQNGLRALFEKELKEIYWTEKALTKAFPKMITNAQTPELINAVSDHLDMTFGHVRRLEKLFYDLGLELVQHKSDVAGLLINALDNVIENMEEGVVRDAAIVAIAQKIEHHEIATYGTLRAFAHILEESEALELINKTLEEEKEADEILASIANTSISLDVTYDYFNYRTGKRRTA